MSDLTEFLLARVSEDEEQIKSGRSLGGGAVLWDDEAISRAEAECEAKRRIITEHTLEGNADLPVCRHLADEPCLTLHALASVYADHPGYRDEWRP